jgi:hypothetical protein
MRSFITCTIQAKEDEIAERVARMGEMSNIYLVLAEKPEEKISPGTPGRKLMIILDWVLGK